MSAHEIMHAALEVPDEGAQTKEGAEVQAVAPHILRSPTDRPLPTQRQHHVMFATLLVVMILAGWNDGSTGPLLPSLQSYYDVNYVIISLVWVSNCVGFFGAGVSNVFLADHLGFGYTIALGALAQAVAYCLMCFGGPFPLFVVAFAINGWGLGIQDAQANTLLSRLPNAAVKMSVAHAVYGLGATVAPLVSTQFVIHVSRFYLYYVISVALAAFTSTLLLVVFRGRQEDEIVGVKPRDGDYEERLQQGKEGERNSAGKLGRLLRIPAVHYMAFYCLIYVGVEIGIGGWITSFMISERGGDDSSGYIPSGFYGGLTVGRIVLIPVTRMLGNQMSVYAYTVVCIGLELVIWFVKDFIGDAVAFSLVGLFLGPMYPIIMMVCSEVIPGSLSTGAIGWIASFGQAGSAILPFVTGALADGYGVWAMQPLMVALLAASLVLWFLVPSKPQVKVIKEKEERTAV